MSSDNLSIQQIEAREDGLSNPNSLKENMYNLSKHQLKVHQESLDKQQLENNVLRTEKVQNDSSNQELLQENIYNSNMQRSEEQADNLTKQHLQNNDILIKPELLEEKMFSLTNQLLPSNADFSNQQSLQKINFNLNIHQLHGNKDLNNQQSLQCNIFSPSIQQLQNNDLSKQQLLQENIYGQFDENENICKNLHETKDGEEGEKNRKKKSKVKEFKDIESQKIHPRQTCLKITSLVTLTLQTAVIFISMRYAQLKPKEELFISTTSVVLTEGTKLITSILFAFLEEKGNGNSFFKLLKSNTIDSPLEILKIGFSSFLYVIQANLMYVSASNLDASTTQITYQLKILATAILAVIILKTKLALIQWMALVMLLIGVIIVQITGGEEKHKPKGFAENRLLGIFSTVTAAILSSLAGVCLEKMFKNPNVSLWMRNIQLSFMSTLLSTMTCLITDIKKIREHGFFYNYNGFVIYLVVLSASNGIINAVAIKYADSILRNFALSMSIIIACILQIFIFDYVVRSMLNLIIGLSLVLLSMFLYGKPSILKRWVSYDKF